VTSLAATPRASNRGLERWAALGGVAYVILFIVGVIVLSSGQPDSDAPPAKVQAYFADSGHRDKVGIGWIIVVLGLFCFLWFLAALRQTLLRLEPDGFLTAVASIGGIVYAGLAFAGISVEMAIFTMSDDTYRHTVYPGLIHAANDTGYVLHAAGGIGAGTMMIGASLVAFRAGAVARWLGWVGVGAGVLALASIVFFPMILIALWLLVASVGLFLRSGQGAQSAPR
jgi:hypothetical protein